MRKLNWLWILVLPFLLLACQNANKHLREAKTALDEGKYADAVESYSKAIEIDDSNANAFYSRGVAYYYLKDYDAAIRDFNRALQLDDQYTNAYYSRGLANDRSGRLEAAIADFNRALELNDSNANAYYARALTYVRLKDNDKALRDLQTYAQLAGSPDPNALQLMETLGG